MEHIISSSEQPSSAVNSVIPTPSTGRTSGGGQIGLKDFGLFTCIKLVLTATTPLVGGLSLSKEEQRLTNFSVQIKDESEGNIEVC